ncbi:hypothetical protein MTBBW1_1470012 [Desulfamplus magnetovallimortis]|uniref:Sulfotransferase domain-containing protein n=1 Tax=Desulfamplus magnetovallimortis TaxID=1246637 RepID=A0A1W1H8A5_9BACT|nr:sulfotransferase [Desulfamplus magnetovallimortis]SLM28699.1 hypothetical protein MTBBW1_1470012 [Desulfamplus magnetovallimortis]
MDSNTKNKTVIYIMSDVRSGSTLLENILSKSPNSISVGELHHLDSHLYKGKWGKTWNWNCSCGKSIKNCEFWKKILANLQNKNIQIENTSLMPVIKDNNIAGKDEQYNIKVIKLINEIYTAIFEEMNVDVLIDSSKHTDHGIMLCRESNYKVKIIYLKRDIRAVALSKEKWAKKFNTDEKNHIYRILIRSKKHDIRLKRKLKEIPKEDVIKIQYEQLAHHPNATINKIIKKFNLSHFKVPEYMDIDNSHTIGGTPSRFEKNKIVCDSKWVKISKGKPVFHIFGKIIDLI